MNWLGHFMVRHRVAVGLGLLAVTLFLGWRASLLKEDLSFETLYPPRSPEMDFSETFSETFGRVNEIVGVAITGKDVFSPDFLAALGRMTRRIEKLEHVDVVYSLANARYIKATPDGLDVSEFLSKPPANPRESRRLEEAARGYELYRGRLISADGKYTAVAVQMERIVGRPCDALAAEVLAGLGSPDPAVRDFSVSRLVEMRTRVAASLRRDDPRLAQWAGQLNSPDAAIRARGVQGLAGAGAKAVRALTVEDRRALIGRIEKIVEEERPPGYTSFVTGTNVVERDYAKIIKKDKIVFHTLVVIVIFVAFFLSFRSWRDTLVAMVSLFLSAACALGAVELVGGVIDIINSVVLLMVLIFSTSNIIYMTDEFYRQWRREDKADAGRKAALRMNDTVGWACFLVDFTTVCGFASLYSAKIGTIAHFGINMAVAILATYVVSLISMLLMLSYVKTVPLSRRRQSGGPALMARLLKGIADVVTRRWRWVMAAWVVALGVLSIGFAQLYVETHAVAELPDDSPTKKNIQAMDNLAGFIGFEVSVKSAGPGKVIDPAVLQKVDAIESYLRAQPETLRTWSVVDYVKTMNRAANGGKAEQFALPESDAAVDQYLLLYGFSREGLKEMNSLISQDRKWLRVVSRVNDVGAKPYLRLKDRVESLGKELFPGGDVEVRVTSDMCLLHMSMDNMSRDMISSIMWAFLSVGIIMGIALRSVPFGLVTIPPNVVPLLATLGFMGWTGIALRVGTLVVFSLGLGVAVNNTIYYLMRYRQLRPGCAGYESCTFSTYAQVGESMIVSSLLLVAGFLCTLFATFKSLWQMGVLCVFTIVVALLADMLITPLLVRFLDRPKGSPAPVPDAPLVPLQARTKEEGI